MVLSLGNWTAEYSLYTQSASGRTEDRADGWKHTDARNPAGTYRGELGTGVDIVAPGISARVGRFAGSARSAESKFAVGIGRFAGIQALDRFVAGILLAGRIVAGEQVRCSTLFP